MGLDSGDMALCNKLTKNEQNYHSREISINKQSQTMLELKIHQNEQCYKNQNNRAEYCAWEKQKGGDVGKTLRSVSNLESNTYCS